MGVRSRKIEIILYKENIQDLDVLENYLKRGTTVAGTKSEKYEGEVCED